MTTFDANFLAESVTAVGLTADHALVGFGLLNEAGEQANLLIRPAVIPTLVARLTAAGERAARTAAQKSGQPVSLHMGPGLPVAATTAQRAPSDEATIRVLAHLTEDGLMLPLDLTREAAEALREALTQALGS